MNPLRYHETIHGRAYVIEVLPVGPDRWRARIVRRDRTTALMPFYGPTPDEAVRMLSGWLTRAARQHADPHEAGRGSSTPALPPRPLAHASRERPGGRR